jgi:hypothetical protein
MNICQVIYYQINIRQSKGSRSINENSSKFLYIFIFIIVLNKQILVYKGSSAVVYSLSIKAPATAMGAVLALAPWALQQ